MNYGILLLLVCVFLGVSAQLLLKSGVDDAGLEINDSNNIISKIFSVIFTPYVFTGFILYGLAALAWLIVLSKFELSYAYPMLAMMYMIIPFAASIFLKEQINSMQWIGIVIISLGVLIVSQSSSQV